MKRFILFSLLVSAAAAAFYTFSPLAPAEVPVPTNGTVIHEGDEEGNQNAREEWFEELHRAAPGVDWRKIEAETAFAKAAHRAKNRNGRFAEHSMNTDTIAGGLLTGTWYERGSNNQAGSVFVTAYDQQADEIWLVSAGGTLFRGKRDGSNWTVVNQDLDFGTDELYLFRTGSAIRLLATINNELHFSDDEGLTWTPSGGTETLGTDDTRSPWQIQVLNDSLKTTYALLPGESRENYMFKSIDGGVSFEQLTSFFVPNSQYYSLIQPHHTDDLFLINSGSNTLLIQFDPMLITLDTLSIANGEKQGEDYHRVIASKVDSTTYFYAFDANGNVHRTTDFGNTWEQRGLLPEEPWSAGLYISKTNPNVLYLGEMECWRSVDGGASWSQVNRWFDYYDDVENQLHADMMYFNEFETADGQVFTLISNHGGLSISYDELETTSNIGLAKLNVSQYYSVKSSPLDPNVIFAGSQDQGFQIADAPGTGIADFEQTISGDYGHIVFTKGGQELWTVYPFGWVTYYQNAFSGSIAASYTMESEQESVWLPPLMESPDTTESAIYMAGGNIDGGEGSFLVKLTVDGAGELVATQGDFDFVVVRNSERLSALEYSPLNRQKMYAATSAGAFYASNDQGTSWERSNRFLVAGNYLYGQSIYASRTEANTVYFGGSGYSNGPVFKSTDGGITFEPMNEGLPQTTVFEITGTSNDSLLFAATEAGPYVYIQSEARWFDLAGLHAPLERYWSVEYLPSLNTVRYGTYGRGIWDFKLDAVEVISAVEEPALNFAVRLYPNPTNAICTVEFQNPDRLPASFTLSNANGQELISRKLPAQQLNVQSTINVAEYPAGIYFVAITIGQQRVVRKIEKY